MSEHRRRSASEVRAWLDEDAPGEGERPTTSAADPRSSPPPPSDRYSKSDVRTRAFDPTKRVAAALFDVGRRAGRSWPAEYGGRARPAWQDDVVAEEQARYGVSTKMLAIAVEMVPPVLFAVRDRRAALGPPAEVVRGDEAGASCSPSPTPGRISPASRR